MRVHARLSKVLLAVLSAVTIVGCGSQQIAQPLATSEQAAHASQSASRDRDNDRSSEPGLAAQDYPVRSFPTQTFYELLVAEFAGVRGHIPLAVDKYVEQAAITRDPNVVKRAVRTASYGKNKAVLKELSYLWVEVEPNSDEARKRAFVFLASDGDIDTAFEYASILLDRADGEPLVALPEFTEKIDTEKRELLLKKYNALEQTRPLDRNILLGKMRLEAQQGYLEHALTTSKILLKLEPGNENARLAIAQLLYSHKQPKKAIAILNEGIERDPQNKKLHLQLIRFIAQTDVAAAQQKMTRLAEIYNDDADLKFSLGLLNKQLGLRDEARQVFQSMISKNRRVADAHFQLALIAEQDEQTDKAISHYAMVGEGKSLLPAIARMTQLMSESGQMTDARLYLHRLRLERPNMVVALYRLESELLMGQERYDSAYSLLTDGLEQHPENFDLLYTRSLVSEKLNDIVSVEQDLRAILDQDINNVSALNALGYSLANHTDRYQEALSLVRQALAINPNDPAIIDSLGWVLYRLGNNEEALTHLRQAMSNIPDPEVAAHLGEVLWVSGAKEEALGIWRRAFENDPDSRYLLDTLNRFEVRL
jgi:tetratricopeptide (TPR) repeat protein